MAPGTNYVQGMHCNDTSFLWRKDSNTFFHVCIVQAVGVTIQCKPATRESWYLIKTQDRHIFFGFSFSRHNLVSLMIQLLFYHQAFGWKRGQACSGRVQDYRKQLESKVFKTYTIC